MQYKYFPNYHRALHLRKFANTRIDPSVQMDICTDERIRVCTDFKTI